MPFRISTTELKGILLVFMFPVAWLLSNTGIVLSLAGRFNIPPLILGIAVVFIPAIVNLLTTNETLPPFLVGIILYLMPAVFGMDVSMLNKYVPGAIVLALGFIMSLLLTWIEKELPTQANRDYLTVSSFVESIVPIPLALLMIIPLLYWSSLGESPRNFLPLFLLLPLLILAQVMLVVAFKGDIRNEERTPKETILILRGFMRVGDSFNLDLVEKREHSITFELSKGFPVERPILLKIEWKDNIPDVVVLISPWETQTLSKAKEWREGEKQYILYVPTSRAPSSPNSASAPR